MHACMYVCNICMYVCMHACMYVCMHACMHVCMYEYMYICIYVYMYACMYVCMHACMYVCMTACMYVWLHVCMYVCMYACMHVCMCVCDKVVCERWCVWKWRECDISEKSFFSLALQCHLPGMRHHCGPGMGGMRCAMIFCAPCGATRCSTWRPRLSYSHESDDDDIEERYLAAKV